jgi:hypothetical protein
MMPEVSTTETLPARRLDDVPAESVDDGPLDVSALVGTWLNTDRGVSGEVDTLVVEESDEKDVLLVRGFGTASEWGQVRAPTFAFGVEGGTAWGFTCEFERDGLHTQIAAYGKEGILIIVTYNDGGDSSSAGFWTREFFHREDL